MKEEEEEKKFTQAEADLKRGQWQRDRPPNLQVAGEGKTPPVRIAVQGERI